MKSKNLWSGISAPKNITLKDDGSTVMHLATGGQFRIQPPPPAITGESVPRSLVRDAVGVLNEISLQTNSARTNPNLSDQGRRNALALGFKNAVFTTGQLWKSVEGFKKSISEREQRLYAIELPNLKDAGAAIRAWEIRQFQASMNAEQKGAFLAKVKSNPEQAAEVVSALLTGPYGVAGDEMAALQEVWQDARRQQNPTEAEAIDADKAAAEWAASAIATIAIPVKEMMASVGGPEPVDLFAQVKMDPVQLGFEAFGISGNDMARAVQIAGFEQPAEATE